jgi:hypothetical protein
VSSGPRATLPTVAEHGTAQRGVVPGDQTSQAAGFPPAATRNPRSVSIATAIGLSAVSPASATNASIGKSTRLQARATPSHRHRAGSATRCAVRSERVQRREPSAITRQQTPSATDPVLGPVTHPYQPMRRNTCRM